MHHCRVFCPLLLSHSIFEKRLFRFAVVFDSIDFIDTLSSTCNSDVIVEELLCIITTRSSYSKVFILSQRFLMIMTILISNAT